MISIQFLKTGLYIFDGQSIFYVFNIKSKSLEFDGKIIITLAKCPHCSSVGRITSNNLYSRSLVIIKCFRWDLGRTSSLIAQMEIRGISSIHYLLLLWLKSMEIKL